MTALPTGEARWSDATLAAACLAVDPAGLGGAVVRAGVEPAREEWLDVVRDFMPRSMPFRRLPLHATEGRLLGGLDLAATLSAGRPVAERGLLAESDGGVLLLPMSERLPASTAALLSTALDTGCVALERDGIAARLPARFALLALDEGESPEESTAASLAERLAFGVDLRGLRTQELLPPALDADDVVAARARLRSVTVPDATLETLCGAAALLGIGSSRAPLFALRAARALAALDGVEQPTSRHVEVAARLVYASRATCLPATDSEPEQRSPPEELPPDPSPGANEDSSTLPDGPLEDRVVAAVSAVLPADVLAGLLAARAARSRHAATGRSGATRASRSRGRPAGVRSGALRPGEHLNLVETLRAAAPWQRLRAHSGSGDRRPRVSVRPDDFRVTRYKHRSPTTTVFVVDASGSSALHRLGEAKGAVELLLADCYVRRDRVALVAFRADRAELVLPPTRSLVRAKRGLAGLAGGGGTPLANAVDAALEIGEALRRQGDTPLLVFLSDGGANVARDGSHGRERAHEDALAAAARLRASGLGAVVIDTSPRPNALAARFAESMSARYLPLPRADSATLSRVVGAEARGAGAGAA